MIGGRLDNPLQPCRVDFRTFGLELQWKPGFLGWRIITLDYNSILLTAGPNGHNVVSLY